MPESLGFFFSSTLVLNPAGNLLLKQCTCIYIYICMYVCTYMLPHENWTVSSKLQSLQYLDIVTSGVVCMPMPTKWCHRLAKLD